MAKLEDFYPLRDVVEAHGLPFPIPDRWQTSDEEVMRGYIKAAKSIIESPGIEWIHRSDFSAGIREHIDTRYRDCWDDMVAAYFAMPPGRIERGQVAYWLMQTAGASKKYVEKVLQVVLQEDPAEIWEFSPWLMVRINQEQWDRLAPMLTEPSLLKRNVNFINRKRARIEKNGVSPWISGIDFNAAD